MTDPFGVLGLGPDATSDDVRAARRELAKRHHPDRGGDPAAMQAVNEAADDVLLRISPHPRHRPAGTPAGDDLSATRPRPDSSLTSRGAV